MDMERNGGGTKGITVLAVLACMLLLAGWGAAAGYSGDNETRRGQRSVAASGAAPAADGAGTGAGAVDSGLAEALAGLQAAGSGLAAPGAPLRLVVKWQGEADAAVSGPAGEAAAELAAALGLEERLPAGTAKAHRYAGGPAADGGAEAPRVTLLWSETGGGHSYAVVSFEAAAWNGAPGVAAAAERAGALMRGLGVAAEWNVSVQAAVAGTEEAAPDAGAALEAAADAAEAKLAGVFGAVQAAEAYADAGSVSRTYAGAGLTRTVDSAGTAVGLQLALHREAGAEADRVTIGMPLITIEY